MNTTARNRRKRNALRNSLALLVALGVTAYYLMDFDHAALPLSLSPTDSYKAIDQQPDGFATSVVRHQYHIDGTLDYKLTARKIEFHDVELNDTANGPADNGQTAKGSASKVDPFALGNEDLDYAPTDHRNGDYADVYEPKFFLYDGEQLAVALSSRMATLFNKGNDLHLHRAVQLADFARATTINAEEMTISLILKQAMSESVVEIKTEQSFTESRGLHGRLDQGKWHLVSEVRSVIQP